MLKLSLLCIIATVVAGSGIVAPVSVCTDDADWDCTENTYVRSLRSNALDCAQSSSNVFMNASYFHQSTASYANEVDGSVDGCKQFCMTDPLCGRFCAGFYVDYTGECHFVKKGTEVSHNTGDTKTGETYMKVWPAKKERDSTTEANCADGSCFYLLNASDVADSGTTPHTHNHVPNPNLPRVFTYEQAEAACAKEGRTIASIHSAEQNDIALSFMVDNQQNDMAWLGAVTAHETQKGLEPVMKWSDGTPWDYQQTALHLSSLYGGNHDPRVVLDCYHKKCQWATCAECDNLMKGVICSAPETTTSSVADEENDACSAKCCLGKWTPVWAKTNKKACKSDEQLWLGSKKWGGVETLDECKALAMSNGNCTSSKTVIHENGKNKNCYCLNTTSCTKTHNSWLNIHEPNFSDVNCMPDALGLILVRHDTTSGHSHKRCYEDEHHINGCRCQCADAPADFTEDNRFHTPQPFSD